MNKDQKTDFLFSSIGEIDDALIEEAMTYKRVRKKSFNFAALAACLALVTVIAIAAPLINRLGNLGGSQAPEEQAASALDVLFLECKGGEYKKYESFDELSYVGTATLVWHYKDSGEIYAVKLTDLQLKYLQSKLGKGESVGEESPRLECLVWILDGKGNVVTPYLKNDSGNVGCAVFDFEAEIIPNEEFVKCISDIMN